MGWNPFKSKTVTTVGVSAVRAIEDALLPQSLKLGVLEGVLDGEDQLIEHVLERAVSGIALGAEKMYRYGKTKYTNGVPQASIATTYSGSGVLQGVIESLENRSVTLVYSQYGTLNFLHHAWAHLVSQYQYDQISNELPGLTAMKGSPVYLEDMVLVIPEAGLLDYDSQSIAQWGISPKSGYTPLRPVGQGSGRYDENAFVAHTPMEVSDSIVDPCVRITYVWNQAYTETINGKPLTRIRVDRESLVIPIENQPAPDGYFHVKYYYTVPTGQYTTGLNGESVPVLRRVYRYFTYKDGSLIHPEIEAIYEPGYDGLGSFFPLAYFRYNKQDLSQYPDSQECKTTTRLLKRVQMDFATIASGINANPDIGDVTEAFLMMGVPANTSNQAELQYLFDFFFKIYAETGAAGVHQNPAFNLVQVSSQNVNGMQPAKSVSMVLRDGKSTLSVQMSGITKKRLAGQIGPVGTYGLNAFTKTEEVPYTHATFGPLENTQLVSLQYHGYRKQVAPNLYDEIQVSGLSITYYVQGNAYVGTGENNVLLIPLDYSVTASYKYRVKEELYARSLHFLFYSKVEQKVKWYQQGWFADLLQIASFVLLIYTLGTSTALSAAIAAGAQAVALLVIQFIVQTIVIQKLFQLFVKAVGLDIAIVFALLAAAYGAFEIIKAGGIKGAPWAMDLIKVSSGLLQGANDLMAKALLGVKESAEAFGIEVAEKTKLLEEGRDLLGDDPILSPFILFGEKPQDYFNRTVHGGNVGSLGIEAVHSYVDYALKLPSLADTLDYA